MLIKKQKQANCLRPYKLFNPKKKTKPSHAMHVNTNHD